MFALSARGYSPVDGLSSRLLTVRTRAADWLRERRADRRFRRRDLPASTPADGAPRHVVCVVVDALRADAVDPALTPFLASLSPASAVSPSTWTFPAVSSLLTGRYPSEHGAIRRTDAYEQSVADVTPLPPAVSGVTTLPERLAGAGYDTFGGFGMIVPFLALSGRFRTHRLAAGADAERLLSEHESWLADRRDERTFSYLHLSDLHEPVTPPVAYREAHDVDDSIPGIERWRYEDVPRGSPTVERYRTHRKRLYGAAAEYVDDRLAASRARLADRVDDALVIVVGDHGEGFWEQAAFHAAHFADSRPAYCVGHGGAPYEAVTRVPVAFAGTGGVDGVEIADVDARVSLIDVAPTVLDAVGLGGVSAGATAGGTAPSPAGVSLLGSVPERRLLVEGVRYGYEKKAVYDGDRKLVVSRGDGVTAGFSLPDETPREFSPRVETSMRAALPPWPEGESRPSEARVSKEARRRLEDLGYT